MALKYNFSILNAAQDPFTGILFEANSATNGMWSYVLLTIVFVVSAYVFARRTSDLNKSLLYSLHIVTITSMLLFYLGKLAGYTLLSEYVVLSMIFYEIITIAGMYYVRMTKNQ